MAETRFTANDEVSEYVHEWSGLPHPLEAAVLSQVNEPGAVVDRAAEAIHLSPPGVEGPMRSVWVLARCGRDGNGPLSLRSWCWYATKAAAEAAESTLAEADDVIVMHETAVPRSVRCDGVEDYLARNYLARSADPH